jgi:hypothetical protein
MAGKDRQGGKQGRASEQHADSGAKGEVPGGHAGSEAAGQSGDEPVREAQELLLAIWKRRTELVEQGKQPGGVVLSRAQYELLQSYNARLGELPNQQLDYIEKYRVFDLPIYVDNDSAMRVMEGQ